jgi:hypothetical protein
MEHGSNTDAIQTTKHANDTKKRHRGGKLRTGISGRSSGGVGRLWLRACREKFVEREKSKAVSSHRTPKLPGRADRIWDNSSACCEIQSCIVAGMATVVRRFLDLAGGGGV